MNQEDLYFEFALDVVRRAGNLVREAFNKSSVAIQTKSSSIDLVTETDKEVEDLLIKELSNKFPDHKFIGEETAATGKKYELTDAPTWIIDPIDGTTNFVHRIPFIAVCVGLAINKELRAGIVYNPITNELYSAQVGKGAHKNGFPIKVSDTETINRAVICTTLGIHNLIEKGEKWLDIALNNHRESVLAGCRGHRAFGSAAINMVYVAQGSIDAYVEYGVHSWDIAAAAVILREASGTIIDPTGDKFCIFKRKVLCAGTKKLATEISKLLKHVDFELEC